MIASWPWPNSNTEPVTLWEPVVAPEPTVDLWDAEGAPEAVLLGPDGRPLAVVRPPIGFALPTPPTKETR